MRNEWIADLAFLVGRLKIDQSAIDNKSEIHSIINLK